MSKQTWDAILWPLLCRILRGDKVPRPGEILMGLKPGKQMSPNHKLLAWAVGMEWLARHGSVEDALALVALREKISREGWSQKTTGLWTMGRNSEQFASDPHAAYWLLPALRFALGAVDHWLPWWRGTVYAWRTVATPDGEILTACARAKMGPWQKIASACYRVLHGLPQRDNRQRAQTLEKWIKAQENEYGPNGPQVAVTELVKALDGPRPRLVLGDLESPVLALPLTVERHGDRHVTTMQPRAGYAPVAPCWRLTAVYGAKGPERAVWSLEEPPRQPESQKPGKLVATGPQAPHKLAV